MAQFVATNISYNAPQYGQNNYTQTFTGNQVLASRPVASGGTHTALVIQRVGGLQYWAITDVAFQFTNSTVRIPFIARFQVTGGTSTLSSGYNNGLDPTVNYEINGDPTTWFNVFSLVKNAANDFNVTLVNAAGAAGRVFNIVFSPYPGTTQSMYYLSGGDVPIADGNPSVQVRVDYYRYKMA